MEPHPVRVVVTDDLERSRLTVFFRLLLAIPHFIWLFLWSIAAAVAAVLNWAATLVRGSSPSILHRFLAAYVRYTTQFYAYLFLAANPYPGFEGAPGYPVDCEINPPAPQRRWKVAFRLLLALPAIVLAVVLSGLGGGGGGGTAGGQDDSTSTAYFSGMNVSVAVTVAFLGWLACLARGRMPRGFRDLLSFALRFGAQTAAYTLVLTDRYPDPSPEAGPQPAQSPPVHPVGLSVTDDARRSRLTVFFRLLLVLPHLVWLTLWLFAALLLAVPAWLAALVLGRLPMGLHRFYAALVRYAVHVGAFLYVVANPFPGFTGSPGYPVDLELPGPERQSRWTIGFRLVLVLPAFLVAAALGTVLALVGIYGWFAALVLGRMPVGLRNLGVYVIGYSAQLHAYVFLVTGRYPDSGPFGGGPEDEPQLELELAAAS